MLAYEKFVYRKRAFLCASATTDLRNDAYFSCCEPNGLTLQASYKTEEDAPDGNSEDANSSIGSPDQSTTVPMRKRSPFRSMLRGGGASGAQALKDRLGRLRKRGSENDGARLPRLGRGNRFRGDKSGSRPPVQHAESLSSDEGTKESGSTKETSDDNNVMSPGSSNGNGLLSSPGGLVTSSSDDSSEESGSLESPRRWGEDAGKSGGGGGANAKSVSTTIAGKATPQVSQLGSGLFRLTRKKSRQPPATRASASSGSSSATSADEKDEGRDYPGTDSLPKSRVSAGARLVDNRLSREQQSSSRRTHSRFGRSKRHGDSTNRGRQRTSSGTEPADAGSDSGGEPTSRSSQSGGAPLRERRRERMLPSWPRFVSGWRLLGDAGEREMTVSGVGRPAAGMLENTMYSWFGEVVGRAWPGVGLALNPVVTGKDMKQVISPRVAGFVTV